MMRSTLLSSFGLFTIYNLNNMILLSIHEQLLPYLLPYAPFLRCTGRHGCIITGECLTWFFKSSLGHGRPPLKAFSLSHLDLIFKPLPQDALQADQADQSLSLQSSGQGMWQTSSMYPEIEQWQTDRGVRSQDHFLNVREMCPCPVLCQILDSLIIALRANYAVPYFQKSCLSLYNLQSIHFESFKHLSEVLTRWPF